MTFHFKSVLRNGCQISFIVLLSASAAFAENQVTNSNFDSGLDGWWGTDNAVLNLVEGQLCVDVPAGTANPWDVIVGVNDLTLAQGTDYEFAFSASGAGGPIRALVQMPVDPWTAYATILEQASVDGGDYTIGFTAAVDLDNAQMVFQIGGASEAWTLCLDNVALNSEAVLEVYKAATGPRVRVNQVGYLPDGPKNATLVTDGNTPVDWQLMDGSGAEVANGKSWPFGLDKSAGETTHTIDFSGVEAVGEGFTLVADGETSYPFTIGPDIYQQLRLDALHYFYPVRSGIEIDGAIAGAAYARPAGHLSVAPNTGDVAVGCQTAEYSETVYGEPWTCDYTLDVTGGWYDAGDHGKYVVNGGISVAQLLSTYERALTLGHADILGDGTLGIPETGYITPDILDEARWELEWMLKMLVPEGQPMEGLYHHKVHDSTWTGLPLMPHLDDRVRELHRPSTAATLNVAATAAQGARLFIRHDLRFAETLMDAARDAYEAAKATPDLFAPGADGASGGGPYDDDQLSDEFYWAAVELYLTTGEAGYLADAKASEHWAGDVFRPQGFDWAYVATLARINLATVPNGLSDADLAAIQQSVIDGANGYLSSQDTESFGQVYSPESGLYDWGSNHLHLQNAIVLGVAYDLSDDTKYRDGMLEAMDYIFGRNALNLSYVTGYGTEFVENQHSRWFAAQINPELPHPPVGSLSGGPNSSIQDPVAQGLFGAQGCAPQKCYIDNIESWSTNEITINWNAALAQIASILADQ